MAERAARAIVPRVLDLGVGIVRTAFVRLALPGLAMGALLGVMPGAPKPHASGAAKAEALSGVVLADTSGRIVAANADGSGVRLLTHPAGDDLDIDPVAAPDGSLIAFTRSYSDSSGGAIEVMRADGSGLRKIAEGEHAEWAPDGALLAFNDGPTIYVMKSNGTEGHILATDYDAQGLAWSPDSQYIAYASRRGGISVALADGGWRSMLLKMDGASRPAWSPDGSRIAFIGEFIGNQGRVVVMDEDGTGAHPLGPTPRDDNTPAWSPDSTRLAFGAYAYPKPGPVVVVDASTGKVEARIPPLAGGESTTPSWSPAGDRLAFLRSSDADGYADLDGDVWVALADGTHPIQVTWNFPFGGSQSAPRWLPDVASITPDAPVAAAALRPAASRPLGQRYLVAAVDGSAVAIVADFNAESRVNAHGGVLGIWRGHGAVSWVHTQCAQRVALSGSRVYWNCSGGDDDTSTSELWTATWLGGRAVRLVHTDGPVATVEGDRTLAVYTLQHSLWRLEGTTARRIRREDTDLSPLSVDKGRVLLENGHNRMEVVNANGKLIASIPAGKNDVWASLSGNRVVALGQSKIRVYSLPGGRLRSTWPVGVPGRAWFAGFPFGSLFPYRTTTAWDEALFRVLDLDTGHDVAVTVPNGVSPITAGITSAGLFYTATPLYTASTDRSGS
jgi:Tol biopolymer transport system component